MLKKVFIPLLFLSLFIQHLPAAETWDADSALAAREDSLIELRREMLHANEQFLRFNLNEKLIDCWMETLRIKGSAKYDFSRIDSMYIVTSRDRKLRIVTWHILNDDRSYDMFGIVQAFSKSKDKYVVYELQDRSENLKNPEYEMLRQGEWFGALYFDIIQVERYKNFVNKILGKSRTYYTLLGWNGNDFKTDFKIIDIASLRSGGNVMFGYPLFRTQDRRLKRIIFEYADKAPMSLKYQKQYILEEKKGKNQNQRRRRKIKKPPKPFEEKKDKEFKAQKKEKKKKEEGTEITPTKMIVFEKLIPLKPELEGIPSQRIPHPEDYDAFVFQRGRWTFHDNVDALNPPSKYDDYQEHQYLDDFQLFKNRE